MLRKPWVTATAALNRAVLRYWPVGLGRVFLWRAVNRLNSRHGVELVGRARWGGRFWCDLRDLVQSRIYYAGVWEPSLTAFVQATLRPGDVFVDVGANVGYYTLLGSRLVGEGGRVVAIDASPHVFGRLQRNLALNGATNVRALNVAVTAEPGEVEVFLGPPTNLGASALTMPGGGRAEATVRALPLTDILAPDEIERVRLLKIDVEGFEGPVLRQLLSCLDAMRPDVAIAVELSPVGLRESGESPEALFEAFRAAGFTWAFVENDYSFRGWYDTTVHRPEPADAPPTTVRDVIFARQPAAVGPRAPAGGGALAAAPQEKLPGALRRN